MFSPLNLIVAAVSVSLLLGSYFTGRDAGKTACEADWATERTGLVAVWKQEVDRKQAVADDLARGLAKAEQARTIVYKETVREIPAATLGRPCLSGDALGLLDRFAGAAAGLPAPAGEPADQGDAAASDTQVAQWVAEAIEQHERERGVCNALIDWHGGSD